MLILGCGKRWKNDESLLKNDFSYYGSGQKIMNGKEITKLLKEFGAI